LLSLNGVVPKEFEICEDGEERKRGAESESLKVELAGATQVIASGLSVADLLKGAIEGGDVEGRSRDVNHGIITQAQRRDRPMVDDPGIALEAEIDQGRPGRPDDDPASGRV
jgi:hypothetical protein